MEKEIIKIADRPDLKKKAAEWFSDKWSVPREAYEESMDQAIMGLEPYPQWYVIMDGDKIVAGLGIIDNDFHDRKDLFPNVCAVYTEPGYRSMGLAGSLLDNVVKEMKEKFVTPVYLITDLDSFYEKYGWEFYCQVKSDDGTTSRMYIHK